MKRIFIVFFMTITAPLFCMQLREQTTSVDPLVSGKPADLLIRIAPEIASSSIEDLRTVRSKSQEEKALMFAKFKDGFPLEKSLTRVKSLKDPQVVIWFTNYFGSVNKDTADWYQREVFTKLPNATLWLTDLKAWTFLSVDKEQLKKNYSSIVAQLENIQKAKNSNEKWEPLKECPLITKSSDILVTSSNKYKVLSSKEFFVWLQKCDPKIISDEICNQLCKEYQREDSLRFSLSDLGYKSSCLDRTIPKLSGQTILNTDFSKIFPILQYIEGIYYSKAIIESNPKKENNIVFLLPNKEFTYYIIPQEKPYFQNFTQGVQTATKNCAQGSISFEAFAYEKDKNDNKDPKYFYEVPYEGNGTRLTKTALLKILEEKKS